MIQNYREDGSLLLGLGATGVGTNLSILTTEGITYWGKKVIKRGNSLNLQDGPSEVCPEHVT